MGLIDDAIGIFDSANRNKAQADFEQQKFNYNQFVDGMKMSLNVQKFVTDTNIRMENMEKSDQKDLFNAINVQIDNKTGIINDDEALWKAATDPAVKTLLRNRINKNRWERDNLEAGYEKIYPIEKQMFDAGQAGHDVGELQREGDERFGVDEVPSEGRGQVNSKGSQGQRYANTSQGGFDRSNAPVMRSYQEPGQPARHEMVNSGQGNEKQSNDYNNYNQRADTDALLQDIQHLIGEVEQKKANISGRNTQPQPLNIPGARPQLPPLPQSDLQADPYANVQTPAQIEADKYLLEREDKIEQENYKRYMTGLTSKYKYLDTQGKSIEDEIADTENNILEMQKLMDWIETMASTGRTRSFSPSDILGTGIQQLLAKTVPGFESKLKRPKHVKTAWGEKHSTDTSNIQREIERNMIKIDELNQLSSLYSPGGGQETDKQKLINTGTTHEQDAQISKRKSLFGGYKLGQ